MNILGLYFSGTGNTCYVIKNIGESLKELNHHFDTLSIEDDISVIKEKLNYSDLVIFGFPVYGSMAPFIVRNFVRMNSDLFSGKKICVIATQYLFSGDAGAYFARILRKYGGEVIDIEHFNMPSNLSDADIFPIKNGEENRKKIEGTLKKIVLYSRRISQGKYKRVGDNFISWCMGFFSQRSYFQFAEKTLMKNIKIDNSLCSLCGRCVKLCPAGNLYIEDKKVFHKKSCTLCYRCINVCPVKAISLMTKKKPKVQYEGCKGI